MKESGESPWEQYWGWPSYDSNSKKKLLVPLFSKLDAEGKIGEVVVDVGSGAWSVLDFMPRNLDRKKIAVDIAGSNKESFGVQSLHLDAEKIDQPDALSYKKALLRASEFLGIDPRTEKNTEQADTVIFSEILNYVDYQKVIEGFSKFLKPGGRLIVVNMVNRGIKSLFSDRGLKENESLYDFLARHHFVIEEKDFPWDSHSEIDESKAMVVLVARKEAEGLDSN